MVYLVRIAPSETKKIICVVTYYTKNGLNGQKYFYMYFLYLVIVFLLVFVWIQIGFPAGLGSTAESPVPALPPKIAWNWGNLFPAWLMWSPMTLSLMMSYPPKSLKINCTGMIRNVDKKIGLSARNASLTPPHVRRNKNNRENEKCIYANMYISAPPNPKPLQSQTSTPECSMRIQLKAEQPYQLISSGEKQPFNCTYHISAAQGYLQLSKSKIHKNAQFSTLGPN